MTLAESLDALFELMERSERDVAVAQGDELVVAHPQGRHGLFVRDGGFVDIASGTQVVGLNSMGLVADLNVLDCRASVVSFNTQSLWINTLPGGFIVDGYAADVGILHGELIGRYLRDAKVVITRGSLKQIQKARGDKASSPVESPVCQECPNLVSVPLSSLIEPFGWSRPLDAKLLSRFNQVLNRVRGL
jgi:hypothetical protein